MFEKKLNETQNIQFFKAFKIGEKYSDKISICLPYSRDVDIHVWLCIHRISCISQKNESNSLLT